MILLEQEFVTRMEDSQPVLHYFSYHRNDVCVTEL